MRDRAWRRYKHEVKTINRLRKQKDRRQWWHGVSDVNGHNHINPTISCFIATYHHFDAKTLSTTNYTSNNKYKYSSNKQKPYGRSGKGPFREKDARELLRILKENGLK